MTTRSLPKDFLLGTSTSAFQIEGANQTDGRGLSIWDWFAEQPGAIADGSDGSVACDHYHRFRSDIALISDLGLSAYRFSIAWPRVIPDGDGAVNEAGLDFYDRLVDGLLEAGIEPHVTLYHWDLPLALHERGGWPSRVVVDPFVRYTDVVAQRLGDRVASWATHNEPWCAAILGYELGVHAPGYKDQAACLAAAHHLLLSHGLAVQALRARLPECEAGIVLNLAMAEAATPSPGDEQARLHADGRLNGWFLDPVFGRGYPQHVIDNLQADMSFVKPGDMEQIAAPIDFLGVNYYTRPVVTADSPDSAEHRALPPRSERVTDIGWEVIPSGLSKLLHWLHETFAPKRILVTENGAAYHTAPDETGRIPDVARTQYLHDHLLEILDAREAGVPVDGWFVWSLMDNFEWAFGYLQRFGIVWVDYETLERTPKDSALWVQSLCENRQIPPLNQSDSAD